MLNLSIICYFELIWRHDTRNHSSIDEANIQRAPPVLGNGRDIHSNIECRMRNRRNNASEEITVLIIYASKVLYTQTLASSMNVTMIFCTQLVLKYQ